MSKLSVKLIESIKPTDKRQRVLDTTVQGLSLVVQPSGKKLFQYRYRFDKKDKSVTLGTVPAMSLKEARDKAVDFRRMLDMNTDPLHSQRQQKAIEINRTTNSTRNDKAHLLCYTNASDIPISKLSNHPFAPVPVL